MPTALIETPTFDNQVLVIDDGDNLEKANLAPAHQVHANRAQYLRNRVEVAGVKRVQYVASLAALKADSAHADGDTMLVGTLGVYRFAAGTSGTELSPQAVTASAGIAGTWYQAGEGPAAHNIPNGVAGLDAQGKVAVANTHNAIVASYAWHGTTEDVQNITAPNTTVAGVQYAVPGVQAGDVLLVDGHLSLTVNGLAQMALRAGTTTLLTKFLATAQYMQSVSFAGGRYEATAAGLVVLSYVATQVNNGASIYVAGTAGGFPATHASLRVTHIRP